MSRRIESPNDVTLRFIEFYKHLSDVGLIDSQADFSQKVGANKGFLSLVLTKKSNFGVDFVCKVGQTFSILNVEWLILGVGEMLKTTGDNAHYTSQLFETSNLIAAEPTISYNKPSPIVATPNQLLLDYNNSLKDNNEHLKRYILLLERNMQMAMDENVVLRDKLNKIEGRL